MKKVLTFLLFIIVSVFNLFAQNGHNITVNLALSDDNSTAILTTGSNDIILNTHFKGFVTTPNKLPVNNVLVHLNNLSYITTNDGSFDFDLSLVSNPENLKLSLSKDDKPKNGVSILDMFLISQNILQKKVFDEDWKRIAADVNSDNKVSTSDLVQLRRLILGLSSSFHPYSDSWKFITDGIKYNPSNPDSIYNITAIKLGDVSGNVDPSQFTNEELDVRGDPIVISSKNIKLFANKSYRIDFNLERKEDITALQFTLEGLKRFIDIQNVIPGKIANFSDLNYSLFKQDNLLTIAWDNADDISFPSKSVLFSLIVNIKHDIDLIDAFKISSKVTKSVGYNTKGETVPINLDINGDVNNTSPLSLSFGPNPVQDQLQLSMDLPADTQLKMFLIDNLGRSYHSVYDNKLEKGHQSFSLDFSPYANGVYFLQIEMNGVKQPLEKLMLYR